MSMNDSAIEAPISFAVERLKTSDVCKKKHKPEFYIKFEEIKHGVHWFQFYINR